MLALLILFVILQVADGVTTYIGLSGRGVAEGWFVAAWIIDRIGLAPALVISKLTVAGLGWFISLFPQGAWVLVPLIALYAYAVFNAIRVIRRARR